jgi:endonuclease/exonuclease/phosphatase family metal-dependent hydrolase
LPWVGAPEEIASGVNPRIAICLKINEHLTRLVSVDDALVVLGGDMNEDYHPVRILSATLKELFQSLDMAAPITHPIRPSHALEEARPNRTLDWLLFRGGRPLCAMAKTIRGGAPAPSDHTPVVGVFEF